MATTRIQKWGNSYGLRIPKRILDDLAIQPDTQLEIRQEGDRIIITPVSERDRQLQLLLAQITSDNLPGELDWGNSRGGEAW